MVLDEGEKVRVAPGAIEGTIIGRDIKLIKGSDLFAVVPEPGTYAILGSCLMTVVVAKRRLPKKR